MFQLKFSDNYENLIEDISYWKEEADIPKTIIDFIKNTSDQIVIYEEVTNHFYCGKCLHSLTEDFYCSFCQIAHKKMEKNKDDLEVCKDVKVVSEIENIYHEFCSFYCFYYIFDKVEDQVFLYLLRELVYYKKYFTQIYKYSKIDILHVYLVKQDGIHDILNNNYYSFQKNSYAINSEFFEDEISDEEFNEFLRIEHFFWPYINAHLYLDNLEQLKTTCYKYSHLWEYANYLNEQEETISLAQLTYLPLYCKSFEYLLNFKLYRLAFYSASSFKTGNNFQEIFGMEKKYLPFMVEHNISYNQLCALRLYPTFDFSLLQFICQYYDPLETLVSSFKIDCKQLRQYLSKNQLEEENVIEYYDYLILAQQLGLDMKNKKVLFPNHLLEAHDQLYMQMEMFYDPQIDQKINHLSKILSLNQYEDEIYVIYPADSIQSLIDESTQQKNCVRTYCKRIAHNECQIYFMRKKENLKQSFVTIEVRENKIVQARLKLNQIPSDDIKKILQKWEKTLLPITTLNVS